MARINADNILFGFMMFSIVAIAYGTSIPSFDVQGNMNTLFAGWPTFQQTVSALSPKSANCASWDWGCQAAAGVAQATAFVGATIAYPGILAASALSRITSFGNLMSFVTFGTATSFGSIPFGNLFLLGLFVVIAIELFRLFRGNPSGL